MDPNNNKTIYFIEKNSNETKTQEEYEKFIQESNNIKDLTEITISNQPLNEHQIQTIKNICNYSNIEILLKFIIRKKCYTILDFLLEKFGIEKIIELFEEDHPKFIIFTDNSKFKKFIPESKKNFLKSYIINETADCKDYRIPIELSIDEKTTLMAKLYNEYFKDLNPNYIEYYRMNMDNENAKSKIELIKKIIEYTNTEYTNKVISYILRNIFSKNKEHFSQSIQDFYEICNDVFLFRYVIIDTLDTMDNKNIIKIINELLNKFKYEIINQIILENIKKLQYEDIIEIDDKIWEDNSVVEYIICSKNAYNSSAKTKLTFIEIFDLLNKKIPNKIKNYEDALLNHIVSETDIPQNLFDCNITSVKILNYTLILDLYDWNDDKYLTPFIKNKDINFLSKIWVLLSRFKINALFKLIKSLFFKIESKSDTEKSNKAIFKTNEVLSNIQKDNTKQCQNPIPNDLNIKK